MMTATQELPRMLNRILTATLLTCGLAVPSASAKCFQNQPLPLSMPAVTPAQPALPGASAMIAPSRIPQAEAATSSTSSASIVGLWNLTVTSGGQVVDVGFDMWHSDGTEVLNDYTNPIEGNVCLGVWKQTGPRTYKLTHPSWYFDGAGNLLGTVVIHETVVLNGDGNSYTGSSTEDVYDVYGNFQGALTGELSATRIKP